MSLSIDEIKANWSMYSDLLRRLSDSNVNDLLDSIGKKIVDCPFSTRVDYGWCYPGGLVEHSLLVASKMRLINDALKYNAPVASILKSALLHDIGKTGDDELYFVEETSDWHREKLGQNYKINEKIDKMSLSHRSLFILQSHGVSLEREEWLAIQIATGSHFEENRFYVGSEPTLALLLQQAKAHAFHELKSKV